VSASETAGDDWALFEDWCTAMGHQMMPASVDTLNGFLTAVPGRPSTTRRRLRAIRAKHLAARMVLPIELPTPSTTIRTGQGWVTIDRALAQLPTLRYPVGLRGRRDGWLLVLIGVLGLSRRETLEVTGAQVQLFPEIRVAGRLVPRAVLAVECPACAVTRWLRVVGPAAAGYKSIVQEMLDPRGVNDQAHDCAVGFDGSWREVDVLAVAIDHAGWVAAGRPLSATSVSAIMKARQWPAGDPLRSSAARRQSDGRFHDVTAAELYDAMGDTDDQVDAELARSRAALDQALATLSELDDIWNPTR
jgi:hypothetical protein